MKKKLLTILSICLCTFAYGQQTEFHLLLNAGLLNYSGQSAETVSDINYGRDGDMAYINSPYGALLGLGGGISADIKRVTKHRFVYGADLGFELLRSKLRIATVRGYNDNGFYNLDVTGRGYLNNCFLNLQPFIGYRFEIVQVSLDLTAGLDIGYSFFAYDNSRSKTADGTIIKTVRERSLPLVDFRPRLQLAAQYQKYGAYVGYSFGLKNYTADMIGGGPHSAYTRLLRFGLSYRLN